MDLETKTMKRDIMIIMLMNGMKN